MLCTLLALHDLSILQTRGQSANDCGKRAFLMFSGRCQNGHKCVILTAYL